MLNHQLFISGRNSSMQVLFFVFCWFSTWQYIRLLIHKDLRWSELLLLLFHFSSFFSEVAVWWCGFVRSERFPQISSQWNSINFSRIPASATAYWSICCARGRKGADSFTFISLKLCLGHIMSINMNTLCPCEWWPKFLNELLYFETRNERILPIFCVPNSKRAELRENVSPWVFRRKEKQRCSMFGPRCELLPVTYFWCFCHNDSAEMLSGGWCVKKLSKCSSADRLTINSHTINSVDCCFLCPSFHSPVLKQHDRKRNWTRSSGSWTLLGFPTLRSWCTGLMRNFSKGLNWTKSLQCDTRGS